MKLNEATDRMRRRRFGDHKLLSALKFFATWLTAPGPKPEPLRDWPAAERRRVSESLSENSKGCFFRGEGWMARRDEGKYPSWVFD